MSNVQLIQNRCNHLRTLTENVEGNLQKLRKELKVFPPPMSPDDIVKFLAKETKQLREAVIVINTMEKELLNGVL